MKDFLKRPLVYLPLLTILSFFSAIPAFWLARTGFINSNSTIFFLIISIGASTTMLVLPLLLIKHIWNEKVSDYGLRLPEKVTYAVKLTSLTFIPLVPLTVLLSKATSFRSFYMIDHPLSIIFFLELILSLIYFLSEEFLFRGFLLFSLQQKLGWRGFWIVNIIFSLLHIGKASGEIFISFFIGIIFSYLSIKTRSILPAVVLHFSMAIMLNFLIFFLS
jgi:membrane protease YdiL (CAAX protease family)